MISIFWSHHICWYCKDHVRKFIMELHVQYRAQFLPKNTTSKTQPMDAGIIAAIKRHYRKRHIDYAMNLDYCDAENINNVSQLQGMVWMRAVWNQLSSDVNKNFWRHTGLSDKHDNLLVDLTPAVMANAEDELGENEKPIAELVPARTRMTVSELLKPGEDED